MGLNMLPYSYRGAEPFLFPNKSESCEIEGEDVFLSMVDSSAADQREQLLSYKKQLEGIAKKRLLAAVDQRDHPTILLFIKLYTPLGLEEEGLQIYVSYLKKGHFHEIEDGIRVVDGTHGATK
ncbi:hypothetical protein CDL12_17102 [Handroanthus impetiginosus]|uniref:Uncharacterized protein n=1 Tax=Handroanthus impetiginosus TaxID=429701 RepID=A0A2G9GYF2_9LAMI|nr:hypothetical protein CDL12_17102 [Handroanthus impetiginosus]